MGRRARIKGFRPGKAPLKVIRQQYGAQVREDVVSEMVRTSWIQAVSEKQLRPVGNPRIESHQVSAEEGLSFTAVFEVFPEIDLKGHEGIEVERPTAEIGAAEIDDMIEKLRAQRGHWHEVDRAAGTGDRVTIDFAGTIDGEPFNGGDGNQVPVLLGEGRMLKDFEAGLDGIAAGEERTIELTFPADYGSGEVAGKTARFKVTARKVEEPHLPEVDEDFCQSFGVMEGGIEQLRAEVEENMREEMRQRAHDVVKRQLLDKLVAANEFEVPSVLLEQEIESLRRDMARRMNAGNNPAEADLPPREPFAGPARFRVALGLLIGEIVRRYDIKVEPARVQEKLQSIGESYGDAEAVIRIYRGNPELMSQVETAVLEELVVERLLGNAKVSEKTVPFNELMNPSQG